MRRLKSRRAGISLIELMVALTLTSIVVAGSFWIFQEGLQLFRTHQASSDAQVAVMTALSRIASEAVNATPNAAKSYPAGGPAPAGLVFASSTTAGGFSVFDPKTGAIAWQRYVAYYYKPDPSGGDDGEIWRAETPVTPRNPSTIASGNIDIFGVVAPWVLNPTHDTSYFSGLPNQQQRVIARGISGFDVQIYTGTLGGSDAPTTTVRRAFNVVVEAGNKSRALRNGYYIQMESKITPRG